MHETGSIRRFVGLAGLLLMLGGCGGAETAREVEAAAFAGQMAKASARVDAAAQRQQGPAPTSSHRRALVIGSTDPVDATALFDWAQYKFPTHFTPNPTPLTLQDGGVSFTIRAYSTGNYLGVTQSGAVYGLGPFTGNQLVPLGNLVDFTALVRADLCGVYPSQCPDPPTVNVLNECQPLTARALTTGTRVHLEFVAEGPFPGSMVLDLLVEGPTTFEGQSAILMRSTQTTSFGGPVSTVQTQNFLRDAGGGLIETLGKEESTRLGGSNIVTRTVFDPPYVDREFTLARGQSLPRTIHSTTQSISPPGPSTRRAETETITFAARETITLFGKTYDTCRYVENQVGASGPFTIWYHVGTGAVLQLDAGGGVLKLKQGTLNGQPL